MRLDTVTLLMTLMTVTSSQQYYGAGSERGHVAGRLTGQGWTLGQKNQTRNRQDAITVTGNAQQKAKWSGDNALKDNQRVKNEQDRTQSSRLDNHNFGKFNTGLSDIAKQIRDESNKNKHAISDNAQYKRNNINSQEGANQAHAKKTAFKKGDDQNNNVRYVFNKRFKTKSSENGGYDEKNARNFRKLNLLDEKEKDRRVLKGDSQVYRDASDQAQATQHSDWKSSAQQKQAQEGKYGAADRREDQAGKRSSDAARDIDKSDSRYLQKERGKDEAQRLAQDNVGSQAQYAKVNTDAADAYRAVADGKHYGGREIGGGGVSVAGKDGYGLQDAAQAAAAVFAPRGRQEGSGGATKSDFNENTAQHQNAKELASARAGNKEQAVNDFERNNDREAHGQVSGEHDRIQDQFQTGLKDANTRGFTGSAAERDQSARASDSNSAASQSASNLESKNKNEKEALHNRSYLRKIQNDDSENFSRTKQFYHNKKEGGDNDEKLQFDKNEKSRKYGTADEARLSSEGNSRTVHEDGKDSSETRHAEDAKDNSRSLHVDRSASQGARNGWDNRHSAEKTQAASAGNGSDRGLQKSARDDSQSQVFNRQQRQQNQVDSDQRTVDDKQDRARDSAVIAEYLRPTNGRPLGEIRSRDFIDSGLLVGQSLDKKEKEHAIPDVVVDITPIDPPPKAERPRAARPVPVLPEIEQVKAYHPPKYSKSEVSYHTGRAAKQDTLSQPTFGSLGALTLFQGPRIASASVSPEHQTSAEGPKGLQRVQPPPQQSFSSGFGNNLFGNTGGFARFIRGTYAR